MEPCQKEFPKLLATPRFSSHALFMRFHWLALSLFLIVGITTAAGKPRVVVTTDINNGSGDPDDRQSLCHLLWYADVLDIRGIIPGRFSETALDACQQVFEHYQMDYENAANHFQNRGYPEPACFLKEVLWAENDVAIARFSEEARKQEEGPLLVLAWGTMSFLNRTLEAHPDIVANIRVFSIGTHLKSKENGGDGMERNWNGSGRQAIYDRFPNLWWVESDWTYNGMFPGQEAIEIKHALARTFSLKWRILGRKPPSRFTWKRDGIAS